MPDTEPAQRHTANLPGMAEGPVSASVADPEQGGHGFSNNGTGSSQAGVTPPSSPSGDTFITMKATESGESEALPETYAQVTYWEITRHFFIMGWIGFGGPAAHIGLFQRVSSGLICIVRFQMWGSYHSHANLNNYTITHINYTFTRKRWHQS